MEKEDKKRLKLLIIGSAMFFVLAVLVFSIMFYSVYFFKDIALKTIFWMILILLGLTTYYTLISEFLRFYNKKRV